MVRARHFFLTIVTTAAVMAYLYYSSDYYAKRSMAVTPVAPASTAGK